MNEVIGSLVVDQPLRAASFIVTIYGDVVEPRGGALWIGNLIETCRRVGITETLVRTAVSRLVSAGQLVGAREGRRSYYRLTDAARARFAEAAALLYGPRPVADWRFVFVLGQDPDETMQALERDGFAKLGPRLALGTHREPLPVGRVVTFDARTVSDGPDLRDLTGALWNLAGFDEDYRRFVARFRSFTHSAGDPSSLSPADSLISRLLLVHRYRTILLREPRLPKAALPENWSGEEARGIFADVYVRLSEKADEVVGSSFLCEAGGLPTTTPATASRLRRLRDLTAADLHP